MTSLSISASALDTPASAARCRHCGDLCDTGSIVTATGTFCCAGCESVFALLETHGLSAFYTCDVQPGRSQRAANRRDPERFAPLDDPAIAARFVARRADRCEVTFPVPAMHCASCLWLLEQLWRFDPGVVRSDASLLRRAVTVTFRDDVTSARRIAEQLAALGYEPVLDQEPGAPPSAPRRHLYLRLGLAGFAFGNVMLFSIPRYANGAPLDPEFQALFGWLNIAFSVPVLLYSAGPYFTSAWSALRGRAITLDVPIALGLAVLFGRSLIEVVTGTGEGFFDSFGGLVFFLLIGKLFQQKAFDDLSFDRTARSFMPLSVRAGRGDELRATPIAALAPGDTMRLRPGEVIPADAIVDDDEGAIDLAFVTGEEMPVTVVRGQVVQAGGRVSGRALRMTVLRPASTSRLAALWSHPVFSAPRPHRLTTLLDRFGRWFTVSALAMAALGALAWWPDGRKAAEVATAVLIVACPCAFTLAAPITLGTAMGVLGRAGLFLKTPEAALDLGGIDEVVFDKTGTLTMGAESADVHHDGFTADEWRAVQRLAAESVHPISRAIARDAWGTEAIADVRETPGVGITGTIGGRHVAIGRAALFPGRTLAAEPAGADALTTWVAIDGGAPRLVTIAPRERDGVRRAVAALAHRWTVRLLSGDRLSSALVARWQPLFGERLAFNQTPEDKLAAVRAAQRGSRRPVRVAMIGDGLNDAAALAAADVGIAVSDDTACLVPACDAVIRGDRLARLDAFLDYARRGRRVIALAFAVSLLYNAFGLGLALTGRLTPLGTAILMPTSSLTIVAISAGLMRARLGRVLA